jgi:pimeloyl-ACP methyl ester carboxylesterase
MGEGTRLALRGLWAGQPAEDIAEAIAMNRTKGTARSFARTVRDAIDWRGQRRFFGDRAHEVEQLPPIALFWGDRDPLIPISHGRPFLKRVEGVKLETIPGAEHYVHQEQAEAFVARLRAFLDARTQPRARLRLPTRKARRLPRLVGSLQSRHL